MPCPPRMHGCRRDCLHRQLVEDYRAARARDEQLLDDRAIGHRADRALELDRGARLVTFRSWLEQLAGQHVYSRQETA